MPVLNAIGDLIGHFVGKVLAVGGIGILTGAGLAAYGAIMSAANSTPYTNAWALALIGAIVVWQKGIVPLVDALIVATQKPATATKTTVSTKDFLKLGNW